MKVRIEVSEGLPEDEVLIRCGAVDERVERIRRFAQAQAGADEKLVFYKGESEFYFPAGDVLFFETEGEVVYAHTEADAYRTRLRLYELEDALDRRFVRISKSTIVNTAKVYSIQRQLTPAASSVQFAGTHKQVYVSRRYQKTLKLRMQERSFL